ncbi:MAG TPA: hypothetical protein VM600_06210 [Actinomycetota bacterium]|nr:hypothetical protein [Actinomycetota bacterium]
MIPLPTILAELIMALGAALAGASAWALLRPRVRPGSPAPARVQARGRTLTNMFIGLVVFVWGFASFVNSLTS